MEKLSLKTMNIDNYLVQKAIEKVSQALTQEAIDQTTPETITQDQLEAIYNGQFKAPMGYSVGTGWGCDPPVYDDGKLTIITINYDPSGRDIAEFAWLEKSEAIKAKLPTDDILRHWRGEQSYGKAIDELYSGGE